MTNGENYPSPSLHIKGFTFPYWERKFHHQGWKRSFLPSVMASRVEKIFSTRGWFEPWPRTSWQGAKEPELAILKYEIILSFQSIWLILGKYDHLWFWVTGIWAPTFLVKVVTHKLYFSGVTAFSSLSADLRSRLKPTSAKPFLARLAFSLLKPHSCNTF